MFRKSLVLSGLLALGMLAPAASAREYVSRGYTQYDGWYRGVPSYHGFANRDPEIQGTDARRPDFRQEWSGFDQYQWRLKYPLYRDPVHPVHRVESPACTSYVQPNRTDICVTAPAIPPITEVCSRHHRKHHCRHHDWTPCGPNLAPPAADKPEFTADCDKVDRSCVEGD